MKSDFQAAASAQGSDYESAVATILKISGWTVNETNVRIDDVEIDIVATDPVGVGYWIECKGSWLSASGRNGALRHDTTRKALHGAYHLHHCGHVTPYLIVTSHLPKPDSTIGRWIQCAIDVGAVEAAITHDEIGNYA